HLNELSFDVLPKETDEFLTRDRILNAFNLKAKNRAPNIFDAGVVVAEQA
uniref:Uncharacterized protein n=1 Tax=Romanomermis culicivorax TaxID=13658 RepID=A0A915L840_ROMCU